MKRRERHVLTCVLKGNSLWVKAEAKTKIKTSNDIVHWCLIRVRAQFMLQFAGIDGSNSGYGGQFLVQGADEGRQTGEGRMDCSKLWLDRYIWKRRCSLGPGSDAELLMSRTYQVPEKFGV